MAVKAVKTGMIIVGGGVIKHHICNANLMVKIIFSIFFQALNSYFKKKWLYIFFNLNFLQRNGADYSVFINTASEFDGSDSGARPDEAVSWGKIKKDANPVKVIYTI